MKVSIVEVPACFPKVHEAESVGKGDKKYFSCAAPIMPGSANDKALNAAIAAVAKEAWKDKADGVLALIVEKGDIGYKHKPLKSSETGEVYDGFEGMFSLNTSIPETKGRPLVIDGTGVTREEDKEQGRFYTEPNKNGVMFKILTAKDGKPYSGCIVNLSVDVWAQDNANGKRINVQLKGVQFVRDGDAFGGGAPASPDDFPTVSAGADAGDLV